MGNDTIERFGAFVAQSESLLTDRDSSPADSEPPLQEFLAFLARARPTLAAPLRDLANELAPEVQELAEWMLDHDLLRIARRRYDEDAYTNLIAWALHPDTHPASALTRQRGWLRVLWPDEPPHISEVTTPLTQVWTEESGVPDMVLNLADLTVVVEAKTGSREHEAAQTGKDQTLVYPEAVRKVLELPDDKPVHMVFLTPDKRPASNENAILTSYAEFATGLAVGLRDVALPADVRHSLSTIITHFATCSSPGDEDDVVRLVRSSATWLGDEAVVGDDARLLAHLHDLHELKDLPPVRYWSGTARAASPGWWRSPNGRPRTW